MRRASALLFVALGVLLIAFGGWRLSDRASAVNDRHTDPPAPTVKSKHASMSPTSDEAYPFRGTQFTRFVDESYEVCGTPNSESFYQWIVQAYEDSKYRFRGHENLRLEDLLAVEKRDLAGIADVRRKSRAEIELGAQVHRFIKTIIPKFSLDRGFEFCNTVRLGERQCFLQSVLIAGLLQKMGVSAGVMMVNRNIAGEPTNNGHAVTLVRLPDGRDIVVDASEPEPFPHHRGLFGRVGVDYLYVEPVYETRGDTIAYYRSQSGRKRIATSQIRTLDVPFLQSQFWYYRGERAKGGIIAPVKTKTGLEASAKALEMSVKLCPKNPLSVFMLGRTYQSLGKYDQARAEYRQAYRLYNAFGWMPADERESLAWAGGG